MRLYERKNSMNIVVLITAKDAVEAKTISDQLLAKKLIACANIVEGVQSVFWWQGKIDQAKETLMVLKSEQRLFKKIVKTVKAHHSYEVPEIIALPIVDGNPDYLKWIDESVG